MTPDKELQRSPTQQSKTHQVQFAFMKDCISKELPEANSGKSKRKKKKNLAEPAFSEQKLLAKSEKDNHFLASTEIQVDSHSEDEMALGKNSGTTSPGVRLRAARESYAWSMEDVARLLRLPVTIIAALESDDYQQIGYGVYLKGYLRSYLRLLDLPLIWAEDATQLVDGLPPLMTTGKISRSRYLFERFSVPTIYLVLTGLIVMPAIWMATRGGLTQEVVRITPLDVPLSPPSSMQNQANSVMEPTRGEPLSFPDLARTEPVDQPGVVNTPSSAPPFVASMAPFLTHNDFTEKALPQKDNSLTSIHTLKIKLPEASWVEIYDQNGKRLEFGLLAAGTEREYQSSTPLNVRIGNAVRALVELDGNQVDLTPYRYGNVAHFNVSNHSIRENASNL